MQSWGYIPGPHTTIELAAFIVQACHVFLELFSKTVIRKWNVCYALRRGSDFVWGRGQYI